MSRRAERVIAAVVVLIAAAAVVATFLFKQRETHDRDAMLYVPKSTPITPEAALLQKYIRVPTVTGNEIDGARFLVAQLAEAGIPAEIIESAPRRASVYARIKGRTPGGALMLLNHIDVVQPKGKWTRAPFSGSVVINQIYGRGAIDMKGTAICQLAAIRDVARSHRVPEHDIVFLAVADEENGGALGTQWLLDHRPDVFEGVRYALNEGGITELYREQITYFGIETGTKQTVECEVVAPDRERLRAFRIALEPYTQPRDPARVLPGVRAFFKAVAPTRQDSRELLADIDHTIAAGKVWLLPLTYTDLLVNAVLTDRIRRNSDGTWSMRVVLRNLPDEDPDQRLAWLAGIAQEHGVRLGTTTRKQGPSPISPSDTPLFQRIAGEAQRQFHTLAGPEVLIFSATDSRFLRAKGILCYGLQAFPVDFSQSLSIHGADERVRIDWFAQGVELTRRIVWREAFGPS